ncbi:unnamed protein product [Caenorhabditis nigoni]
MLTELNRLEKLMDRILISWRMWHLKMSNWLDMLIGNTRTLATLKYFQPSFPRRRCEEFGKLRVKDDETEYINALGFNVFGWDEVAARGNFPQNGQEVLRTEPRRTASRSRWNRKGVRMTMQKILMGQMIPDSMRWSQSKNRRNS